MMRLFIVGFLELKQQSDQKIKKKKKQLENQCPDLSCLNGKSDFFIQFPETNPVHSLNPLNKKPGIHEEGPCGTVPSMICKLPLCLLKEMKSICQSNCVLRKGKYPDILGYYWKLSLASINLRDTKGNYDPLIRVRTQEGRDICSLGQNPSCNIPKKSPDPFSGYFPIPEDKVVITFWQLVESLYSFSYHKGKGQVK